MEEFGKKIEDLICEGSLMQAAEEIKLFSEKNNYSERKLESVLLISRLTKLKDNRRIGNHSDADLSIAENKIRISLLELAIKCVSDLKASISNEETSQNRRKFKIPTNKGDNLRSNRTENKEQKTSSNKELYKPQPLLSPQKTEWTSWFKKVTIGVGVLMLIFFIVKISPSFEIPVIGEKVEAGIRPFPEIGGSGEKIERTEDKLTKWRPEENGYFFLYDGEQVNGAPTAKDGNDLILFYKKNKTFRLENYFNIADKKLRKAKNEKKLTLDKPLWRKDPDGYAFYYKGERIKDAATLEEDRDLLVFYKDKTFRFENYNNSVVGKLKIANVGI